MTDLPPRDMPRMLAPVLFGAGDIYFGWVRATDPAVHSLPFSQVPGGLSYWGAAFMTLGLIVWAGARWRPMAWLSLAGSVLLWSLWTRFLWDAHTLHPNSVPRPAAPVVIAALHLLLSPYRRNGQWSTFERRRPTSRPT